MFVLIGEIAFMSLKNTMERDIVIYFTTIDATHLNLSVYKTDIA